MNGGHAVRSRVVSDRARLLQGAYSTRFKEGKVIGVALPYLPSGELLGKPEVSVLIGDRIYYGVEPERARLAEDLNPLLNLEIEGIYEIEKEIEGEVVHNMDGETHTFYILTLKTSKGGGKHGEGEGATTGSQDATVLESKLPASVLEKPGLAQRVRGISPMQFHSRSSRNRLQIVVVDTEGYLRVSKRESVRITSDAYYYGKLAEIREGTIRELSAMVRRAIIILQTEMIKGVEF